MIVPIVRNVLKSWRIIYKKKMFAIFQMTFNNEKGHEKIDVWDCCGQENPVNQGPHCLICILRTFFVSINNN